MRWQSLLLVSLVAGCGAPYPQEKVVSSAAAIRAATELDAAREPEAAPHLRAAQRERTQALQLLAGGDNDAARSLLIRAEADADLASAVAKEAPIRREADRVRTEVDAIRAQNHL